MPGSLLLSRDAYSDVSNVSGRSLDTKLVGKKVSFNNAVRVKQYPWQPDLHSGGAEHLTLPTNKFWFKVHKNNRESTSNGNHVQPIRSNAWGDDSMECGLDSLSPIAEVDDQELEYSPPRSPVRSNGYHHLSNGHATHNNLHSPERVNGSAAFNGNNSIYNHSYTPERNNGYTRNLSDEHTISSHKNIYSPESGNEYDVIRNGSNADVGNANSKFSPERKKMDDYERSDHSQYSLLNNNAHLHSQELKSTPRLFSERQNGNTNINYKQNTYSLYNNDNSSHCDDISNGESKRAWSTILTNGINSKDNYELQSSYLQDSAPLWSKNRSNGIYGISEEGGFADNLSYSGSVRIPRMSLRNLSPSRRSLRDPDKFKPSEKRSRSHDDHFRNGNDLKPTYKADKAVSTEDLSSGSSHTSPKNGFYKTSRDMSTQCFGTLTRGKNDSTRGGDPSPPKTSPETISVFERLSRYKSPSSTKSLNNKISSDKVGFPKKDNPLDSQNFKSRHTTAPKKPISSTTYDRSPPFRRYESRFGEHRADSHLKNENASVVTKPQVGAQKSHLSRVDQYSSPVLYGDPKFVRRVSPSSTTQDSADIGYLRGRKIPLTEVNTNTSRKYRSRSETSSSRPANNTENLSPYSLSPNGKHLTTRSSYRGSNREKLTAKKGSDTPQIDWSLSGFQLASRQGREVASDSEAMVHSRPPLLMYIPGVSHHDRPAEEDDRLSALSGLSRSDINEGSGNGNRNLSGDLNGRNSFRRDEKSKWMRWKSKA